MAYDDDIPTFLAEPRSTYDELKRSAEKRFAPGAAARARSRSAELPEPPAPESAAQPVTRVVLPAVDVTAWDVSPGAALVAAELPAVAAAPPEEPAAPAPAEQPAPPAIPGQPSDPLAPAAVADAVQNIVSGGPRKDPEGAVMQGFLDDLASAPHTWSASTALVEEASGGGKPAPTTIFVPGNTSTTYTDFIQPVTEGKLTLLINGRNSNGTGPDIDRTEPLDRMQDVVQSLGPSDSVYLTAWFFSPDTALTRGAYKGATTWGPLLGSKADEGVKIRILINDFDPITKLDTWVRKDNLARLDPIIKALKHPDNLKYVVHLHPAHFGRVTSALAGQGFRNIHMASHHQKLMVCRRGNDTIAFCGGLDIELAKTPSQWGYPPARSLVAWHDLHTQLEGPIARDLQKQFVLRWNREKGDARTKPLPGWGALETLPLPAPLTAADPDNQPAKRPHKIQMLRTVSSDAATSPFSNDRDDIRRVYDNVLALASQFLYFENQYFRSLDFANRLVAAAAAKPALVAIFVVTPDALESDGDNAITQHGVFLQHEFFERVTNAFGARAAIYTMKGRTVHSKLVTADDRWTTIGSANLNERSFQLDSEVNVATDDAACAHAIRKRLWAHNLGTTEAAVDGWPVSDFIPRWDAVANANAPLAAAGRLADMAGEGLIHLDWKAQRGKQNKQIPDWLAHVEVGEDGEVIAMEGDDAVRVMV